MRKDKSNWRVERQQSLFVFQNEIVGRNIIALIRSAPRRTVDFSPTFFVDRKIPRMCRVDVDALEVLFVWRIEQRNEFIINVFILFLEHFAIFGIDLIAIAAVFSVFRHFVDEEQR